MARKFNPKSKILGKYFKSIPYGLKEISTLLDKPLYQESIQVQYQIIMVLLLINKREENLSLFMRLNKESFQNKLSNFISKDKNPKEIISMIRGISNLKREYIFKFLFNDKSYFSNFTVNFIDILTSKDKDLKFCERDFLPSKQENDFFKNRSIKKTFPRIIGKSKNINFEILRANDKRAMYLDDYSDCCQGFDKAGDVCMKDGIMNEDSGFLVFERRGVIFAQGWIRKVNNNTLLIDSIEFKGDFNNSLIDAIEKSVEKLRKNFKNIFLGLSPNRNEISKGLNYKEYRYLERENSEEAKEVFEFTHKTGLYSDARKVILSLTEKGKFIPYIDINEDEIPF